MTTPNFGEVVKLNRTIPEDFSFNGKTTRSSFLYGEIPFGGKLAVSSINQKPTGGAFSVSWHPSGRFLAVGHSTAPYLSVYYFTGSSLVKIPDPTPSADMPISTVTVTEWSPDGNTLVIAQTTGNSVSRGVMFYALDLSGTTPKLEKASAGEQYTNPLSGRFSPNGNYFALTTLTGVYVHRFENNIFTDVNVIQTVDPAHGWPLGVSWHPDGTTLAIAYYGGTAPQIYLALYSFDGENNLTLKLNVTGANALAGPGTDVCWSPDGKYLSVSHGGGFRNTVYSYENNVLTKLAHNDILGPSSGLGVSSDWSPDGKHYANVHEQTPYIQVYSVEDGGSYYVLYNYVAGSPPEGPGRDINWSPDGKFIVVGHDSYPYITVYTSGVGTIRPGSMLQIEPPSNLPHI